MVNRIYINYTECFKNEKTLIEDSWSKFNIFLWKNFRYAFINELLTMANHRARSCDVTLSIKPKRTQIPTIYIEESILNIIIYSFFVISLFINNIYIYYYNIKNIFNYCCYMCSKYIIYHKKTKFKKHWNKKNFIKKNNWNI